MARNFTGPPLEYTEEINTLVRQGFIFQNVAQMPYTPMMDLVDQLLERNESSLNETFGKYLMLPGHTVTSVLEGLQDTLHRLPHDSITHLHEIISGILTAIAILAVASRLYARKCVTPKILRSEDYWSFVTILLLIPMMICTWMLNKNGKGGQHVWDVSLWDYRGAQLWLFICQMWFYPAHLTLKISFLVFYRRLFISRQYRIAIWGVGIFTLATTLIGIFGAIFQCKPVDFWNHFLTRKCIDLAKFYLIRSVLYSLTDFMILILPIPGIWNLKIKTREKVMLIGLFGLGIFISIASVFRLYSLWTWFTSMDFTYRVEIHNIWAIVEFNLAVVVSCAPALKVLFCHQESPLASIPSAIAKGLTTKDGTYNPEGPSTTRSWRWSKLSWSYSTISKKSVAATTTANSSVRPPIDENKDHEMVRVLVTKSVSAETVDARHNQDVEKGVTVDVNVLRE